MRLLQTYSRNCSVDIKHKPKILEKFYPLGNINKYITIQNKSGMPAKDYSYFNEVINLILPYLEKEKIKIIHLGQDSPPLNNVINLNNKTNIGQACFILKRSLLHFGVDSWMCHFCGAEEIPLVSLYGNTTIANHSPYYYNPDKTIFLESHRNGNKATFAREENPKTVDFILPESIAAAILKLLNIPFDYPYKTIFIGQNYHNRTVESANDCVIDTAKLGLTNIIMRCDYNYNLDNLFKQTQMSKVVIITDKILPIEPLQKLKPNIVEILYKIKKENDPGFINSLRQIKISYKLWSQLENEDLNPIKLDYMDYGIIYKKDISIPDVIKKSDLKNLYYKNSNFLLSNGKIYPTYWDYKCDRFVPNFEGTILPILDVNLEELFIDKDNLCFLEKTS